MIYSYFFSSYIHVCLILSNLEFPHENESNWNGYDFEFVIVLFGCQET